MSCLESPSGFEPLPKGFAGNENSLSCLFSLPYGLAFWLFLSAFRHLLFSTCSQIPIT